MSPAQAGLAGAGKAAAEALGKCWMRPLSSTGGVGVEAGAQSKGFWELLDLPAAGQGAGPSEKEPP